MDTLNMGLTGLSMFSALRESCRDNPSFAVDKGNFKQTPQSRPK
ncbi:hypothetical protein JMJ77_0014090 [Colletotrichum scovillei]|uniref:Uncharacterized protein n=1 Tax=Colletotrichum scovillei TaxID=1209932 RepID=A0A9P7R2Q9_9PEZI|nr:hypothetical protein JMJ77_0014090 [Colletotrichum scovillei]KAG7065618.1 hypothetical protein JMJ78_0012366 [Colletotrichum scovillei]KAG7068218.1 hypothetical protein JMJ76_0007909 [Colletotrichum scovillei]